MRSLPVILALSALATVSNANVFDFIKSKLSRDTASKHVQAGAAWPYVEWPFDSQSTGILYTWNATTKELNQFANSTAVTYIDATHNREKIITMTNLTDIGMTEILTFIDVNAGKAYQKVPKTEQCKTFDIPSGFNLTQFQADIANETANFTEYKGVVNLPWVNETTYHKFHIQSPWVNETVYFCTKCHQIKWIVQDDYPEFVLSIPQGPQFRVFTDIEFDGYTCSNTTSESATLDHKLFSKLF